MALIGFRTIYTLNDLLFVPCVLFIERIDSTNTDNTQWKVQLRADAYWRPT